MKHLTSILASMLASAALAQDPLYRLALDQPNLRQWRWKSNCTLVPAPGERGGAVAWRSHFGEFSFGWATHTLKPRVDFTKAGRVTYWVKGDGAGHRLQSQLVLVEPGKASRYYVNTTDAVTIDFTGWREISATLSRFAPPVGCDVIPDLAGKVTHLQFFLTRQGGSAGADLMLDDVRIVPATRQEADAQVALWSEYTSAVSTNVARDGSNLLPNAGFERDLDGNGEPDFWHGNAWGLGSRPVWDGTIAHTGNASVRVECSDDKQRGSFDLQRPITPGPWIFEGWYRTQDMGTPAPRRGVDARLTVQTDGGKHSTAVHAYGEPTNGEWRKARVAFDLPPGVGRVTVYLFNFFAKGTVWWDDVSLCYDVETDRRKAEETRRQADDARKAAAMMDGVLAKIAALPSEAPEDRIKRAALEWAVEDAQAAIDAGLGTRAAELLADTEAALTKPLGKRSTPPANVLPPVPSLDGNPYVPGLLAKAEAVARDETRYGKGDEGYRQIRNAWDFRGMGDRVNVAAWALCYPESPLAGSPELLKGVLRLLQAIFQNHRGGDYNPGREAVHGYDPNINRFTLVPTMDALLVLLHTYPGVLLPSKLEEWRHSMRVASSYQVESYGSPVTAGRYPNMDVHYMHMMGLAGRLLDDKTYTKEGRRFLGFVADCLYADGAFTYHGYQNECYVYHQLNIAHLARYWQLTGDPLARETIVKSRPYYPYNVEPGGVPEYYTDCFWKHYWGGAAPEGPEIVAGITDCPLNKRVANTELQWTKPNSYYAIYAANFYKPFADQPLPDDFIIYDRNIEGPRGRFGRFSFAGTGRVIPSGHQGKDTFVGCLVTDEPTRRFPLNAALQVVTNEFRLAPGGQRWRSCRFLSQDEKNATIVAESFAALTTYYRIQNVAWGGRSTLTDWAANQQWLLTPGRLVGLLEIETLSDQKAHSVHGRVRFGMRQQIEKKDDALFFKYGGLLCRLHEHSYADVVTEKSETFYIDEPERFRSTEIVLRDTASVEAGRGEQLTYPKGTRHHFTVEVLPYWSSLATSVTRVATASGLRGLDVVADGRRFVLLHNPTGTTLSHEFTLANGRAVLHRSGDHRPAPESITLTGGSAKVDVPAYAHVVLESKE